MMRINRRNKADGLKFLRAVPDAYTPLVIFDPQYRQGLDKLKYGNEGARQKGRAILPQMTEEIIRAIGTEIVRVLKPSGYCALWIDKFILCQGLAQSFFTETIPSCASLQIVDLITWDKGRIGMGYRSCRRGEYLMILQKTPIRAKGTWRRSPSIPDVWREDIMGRKHVHQKPYLLHRELIAVTTEPGDVVVNPCAGSFEVMDAAHEADRDFLGCDILGSGRTTATRLA